MTPGEKTCFILAGYGDTSVHMEVESRRKLVFLALLNMEERSADIT
jgi:hypothetical protein